VEIQVSRDEVGPRSTWKRPFSTAGIAGATDATQAATAAAGLEPH
jgi:hypothetical protein